MRLHVANCTHQDINLHYRLIESKRPQMQPCPAGQQAMLSGHDLNTPEIDHLIDQLRAYGLCLVGELKNQPDQKHIPLVGALDRPVEFEVIQRVIGHNRRVLSLRGKKFREEAAIAASNQIGAMTPEAADTLALSVQEETPGTGGDGGDPLNEGIRVTRRGGDGIAA